MATIVDTSVWIDVFRDQTGQARSDLLEAVAEDDIYLTRFNELELLQGAADEREWDLLTTYLSDQWYMELQAESWSNSARIYFDLRRIGRTVRSPIDCCIAQLALENDARLIHRDTDFETINEVRPLRQQRL